MDAGRSTRLRVRTLVVGTAALAAASFGQRPADAGGEIGLGSYAPGRLLVKFKAGTTVGEVKSFIAGGGATESSSIDKIGLHVLALPEGADEHAVARSFRSQRCVEFVEVDAYLPPSDVATSDPYAASQWHLAKIAAPAAWSTTTGAASVVVAVLDTGVDGAHPDLAPHLVAGWNTFDNTADSSDVVGHGTEVAGAAAAVGDNGLGVAGVCWNASIMPIRVSDQFGGGYASTIANGLVWAADHGARVANVSYAVSGIASVASAAQYFQGKGGVVCVSSGNSGSYDASPDNPYLLTVGATDAADVVASWSSTGNNVDLCGPGVGIWTTTRGGGYAAVSGTSFSSPIVAGVAALVISANPTLSPQQVAAAVMQSSDDLGAAGWDATYGMGRVNAASALTVAGQPSTLSLPTATFVTPSAGATLSGTASVQVSAGGPASPSSVTLSLDGAVLANSASATSTFSWDTTTASKGPHSLSATVRDARGLSASSTVSVNVDNTAPNAPPSVVITSPKTGAKTSKTVYVYVAASDDVGVKKVELYVDGTLTSTATASPFTTKWAVNGKTPSGAHTLVCKAYDAAGAVGSSAPVSVYK
jgi:thermitase